ncbi:MAG: GatB/YqeY domain-containing protein [Chlorobi bacterium]|nr:GatB/YqeY domain-containing protein [Chlorobiota bacterium]
MSLEQQVMQALKKAMKEKNKVKLDALRAIKSAILLEKTKDGKQELEPEAEMRLLQKLVKQRKESAEIYEAQNRPDLAAEERAQMEVIASFLPEPLSEAEIEARVRKIIEETGASGMRDMGKVMGVAVKAMAGRADGKTVSQVVKRLLSGS